MFRTVILLMIFALRPLAGVGQPGAAAPTDPGASATPPAGAVALSEGSALSGGSALPQAAALPALPAVGADTLAPRQAPLSLNECMAYAVEHSPAVKQQAYTNRNYREDFIESVAALVPSLSGSVSAATNFGRSVNPETNTYSDVSTLDNSYSISGSIPVFGGLSRINTLRAAKVMRLLGVEELQQARDQVAIRTMQAYFDVVYYMESVQLAREQLETSTANLAKSRKLYELGLKSAADVAEVEAQRASDDFLLIGQLNALELARLTLAEAMNYPTDRPLEVVSEVAIPTPLGTVPLGEVLDYALDNHPQAVGASYHVRRSRLEYAVAKGRYFPSLSMNGGYSTNFFMNLDDRTLYASFHNQFRDNRGYYFSAQLSIPLFGGLSRRTAVHRARNNYRIAEQQRDQTLRALQNEIAQAYQQMTGSGKEFVQATKKSASAELAYRAIEGKYQRGIVSALDVQTSANLLLQARSERLRARLQYIMKTRLVEYYHGEPLIR